MKSRFRYILLMLLYTSCTGEKNCVEDEPFSPKSATYISLETKEGKKYCMTYNELIKVTSFDVFDPQIGRDERIKIYCGAIKIDSKDLAKIWDNMNNVIYEVNPGATIQNIDDMTTKALDSSGIFKIREFEFELRGNIIDYAIKKGYVIYFNDYQGEYFWRKKLNY